MMDDAASLDRQSAYLEQIRSLGRPQRFAGTDRQVRGLLLDVLRGSEHPVTRAALDAVWDEPAQRARALDGLVGDGLVDPLPDGRFALPGPVT